MVPRPRTPDWRATSGNKEYQICRSLFRILGASITNIILVVQYDTGTYTFAVRPKDTLDELKDQIKERLGFEEWGLRRLIYPTWWDQHSGGRTLAECAITKEQTLRIHWRMLSCGPGNPCSHHHEAEEDDGNDDSDDDDDDLKEREEVEEKEDKDERDEEDKKMTTKKRKRDDERQGRKKKMAERWGRMRWGRMSGDKAPKWPTNADVTEEQDRALWKNITEAKAKGDAGTEDAEEEVTQVAAEEEETDQEAPAEPVLRQPRQLSQWAIAARAARDAADGLSTDSEEYEGCSDKENQPWEPNTVPN